MGCGCSGGRSVRGNFFQKQKKINVMWNRAFLSYRKHNGIWTQKWNMVTKNGNENRMGCGCSGSMSVKGFSKTEMKT
jgi:hypothetical protein